MAGGHFAVAVDRHGDFGGRVDVELRRAVFVLLRNHDRHVFDLVLRGQFLGRALQFGRVAADQIHKRRKLLVASRSYIKFLEAGGKLLYAELDENLIKDYLKKSTPILTGLSATYLYGTKREISTSNKYDSIKGEPVGHFAIINGYNANSDYVYLADPMNPNPLKSQYYSVTFDRLINSIMLGIVTYDANLLIIEPK